MGAGFQVFSAAPSVLELDASTDRSGRVLGSVLMTSNGSLSVPALIGAVYFIATVNKGGDVPKVTVNTSTGLISWVTNGAANTMLIYGFL